MLSSLHIENFRGFQEFDLEDLGRINLLVGENNNGKTSILEAILIFLSHGNLNVILELMKYRGEYWREKNDKKGTSESEYAMRHLFYGHEIVQETKFSLKGIDDNSQNQLIIDIRSDPIQQSLNLNNNDDDNQSEKSGNFNLIIKWNHGNFGRSPIEVPLSLNNTLSQDDVRRMSRNLFSDIVINTRLITPFSLDITDLTQLFDNIVLTPNEQLIIEALQIIEAKIERIASVGQEKYSYTSRNYKERGGFVIKFSDQKQPVPIGSLGDGIWRILSIILAMVNLENGVLLVDEIDTGLHFTTLFDMWKVILLTARKLNIQVFATTHNSDCWTSLASLIKKEKIEDNEITIQRIEPDRKKAVAFSPKQIVIAAERGIEVR
ncbi:AAA family ATPase [Crocosphaera sp. UHCC 0190]|uniref:AAA family ATPase n=1 Tax=unclassified Crocosphaera TaxID=2623705 RepID=UPI002B210B4B|nr:MULTISPECIES: AAA family ATPase [unclassified Crocosphaera]MEA5510855.1 AAA family ATPase [Crocosphaera sp. UHCC 0190]MEA5532648.1 AAA family ATPase [Crocosphaera sp. XPORK-15E]